MKQGEIWWASLPAPQASEPGYRRPVLIVQAEAFNDSAIRTVVCVAITSRLALAEAPGNVRLSARESGLPKASVANVSQVVTVDKSFLTERVKSVNPRKFQSVKEGLRLLMGL